LILSFRGYGVSLGPQQFGGKLGPFRLDHVPHFIRDGSDAGEPFELGSNVL
jgi:hypothetical protein